MDTCMFALPIRGRARGRARGTPAPFAQSYNDRQAPNPVGLQRQHSPRGQNKQFQSIDSRPIHVPVYHMAPRMPMGRGSQYDGGSTRGMHNGYGTRNNGPWRSDTRRRQPTYSSPNERWKSNFDRPHGASANHTRAINSRQSDHVQGQYNMSENREERTSSSSCKSSVNEHTADVDESRADGYNGPSPQVCRPPPGFENRPLQYPPVQALLPATSTAATGVANSDGEVNKTGGQGVDNSVKSSLSATAKVFVPRSIICQSGGNTKMLSPPPGLPPQPMGISLNTLGPVTPWNMNNGLSVGKTGVDNESTVEHQYHTSPPASMQAVESESETGRLQDYVSASSNKPTSHPFESLSTPVIKENSPNRESASDINNSTPRDDNSPVSISVEKQDNNVSTINVNNPCLYHSTSQEAEGTFSCNSEQETVCCASPDVSVTHGYRNNTECELQSYGRDDSRSPNMQNDNEFTNPSWQAALPEISHSLHGSNGVPNAGPPQSGRGTFHFSNGNLRGRGGFSITNQSQCGRGGFPITNENLCGPGGLPITNENRCGASGFPITNENRCGRGGFHFINGNHRGRGGFPITNQSQCGRGRGFSITNENRCGRGGFSVANPSHGGRSGFPVTGHRDFVEPTGDPYLPRDGSTERGRRLSCGMSDEQNGSPSLRHSRSSSLDSVDRCRSRKRSSGGDSRHSSLERPSNNSSPQGRYRAQNKTFLSPNDQQPLQSPVRSPKYFKGQYLGNGSSDNWSPGGSPSKRKQEAPDVFLSKTLSMLLRHSANSLGFPLMKGGFLYVTDILGQYDKLNGFTVQDIEDTVHKNDKKRFALDTDAETGRLKIRANQGHTMQVDALELKPILTAGEVDKVIHGTFLTCWDSIKFMGLNRMRRNHIHFAVGEPGRYEVISGMRKECEVMVFINMEKALKDGLKFYRSANNVILSPGNENGVIHPCYFENVIQRMPYMKLEFERSISSGTMTRQEVQDAIRSSKGQKNKIREESELQSRENNRSPTKQASKKLKRMKARNAEIDLSSCGNIFDTSSKAGSEPCASTEFAAESPDDWDDAIVVTDIEQSMCVVDHILTTNMVADIVFCCYGENLGFPGGKLRTVVVVASKLVCVYQFTGDVDFMTEGHLLRLICHTDKNKVFNDIRRISTFLIDQHNILLHGNIWDIELMYDKVRSSLSSINTDRLADMDFCPKQWRFNDSDDSKSDVLVNTALTDRLVKQAKLMFIAFKMFIRCQTELKNLKKDIYAALIPADDERCLAKKIAGLKLDNRNNRKICTEKPNQERNHHNSVKQGTNNGNHNRRKDNKRR